MERKTTKEIFTKRLNDLLDEFKTTKKTTRAKIIDKVGNDIGGLTRTGFANYTSGKSDCPATVLKSLSSVLGVSSDYLLGLTDIKNPSSSVRAICDATGLSETALHNLSLLRGTSLGWLLNKLLENSEVTKELFKILQSQHDDQIHMAKMAAYQEAKEDYKYFNNEREIERVFEKLPIYFEEAQSDDCDSKELYGLTEFDLQAIKKNSFSMGLFSVCDRFCSEDAKKEFRNTYNAVYDKIEDLVNALREDPDFQRDDELGDYDDLP